MAMNSLNRLTKWLTLGFVLCLCLGLQACSSMRSDGAPSGNFNANNIPDAVPKAEPLSRYGNPSSYVVGGKRYYVMKSAKGYDQVGNASWYGTKFHGQHTSSNEPYNMFSMTAASPVLPIPTYVRVTNLANNRSAIVKVNDRGPFRSNRIIDLSYAAAKKLGYANIGTARVRVTAIDVGAPSPDTFYANNATDSKTTTAASAKPVLAMAKSTTTKTTAQQPIRLAQNTAKNNPVYLQIGAFKTRDKAETVRQQVAKITKLNSTEVAIKQGYGDNHTPLYRVHVGPLLDIDKSKQVAELLAQHGFSKPIEVNG